MLNLIHIPPIQMKILEFHAKDWGDKIFMKILCQATLSQGDGYQFFVNT